MRASSSTQSSSRCSGTRLGGVNVVGPHGFLHGLEFVEGLEAECKHPLGIPF